MEFRVGQKRRRHQDLQVAAQEGELRYLGNRFDHEYHFPPQHEFEWKRTHRELHRPGCIPHISIEDRVFVECIGGDLTIKVEDNTATGEGIYREPVEQRDQTLDDAEIFYATIGSLILLKHPALPGKAFRYFVFNEKLKEVRRIDAIEDACVLLPDEHGIIFPRGYLPAERRVQAIRARPGRTCVFTSASSSPNGEDTLFAFYNREGGDYVLLSATT